MADEQIDRHIRYTPLETGGARHEPGDDPAYDPPAPTSSDVRLIKDLRLALTRARDGGAITQAEWTAFSYVPVGQGAGPANAAVAALLAVPKVPERRCGVLHPEYHFTCPYLPADHGRAHFDPSGGWWNENGQLGARDTSPDFDGLTDDPATLHGLISDRLGDIRRIALALGVTITGDVADAVPTVIEVADRAVVTISAPDVVQVGRPVGVDGPTVETGELYEQAWGDSALPEGAAAEFLEVLRRATAGASWILRQPRRVSDDDHGHVAELVAAHVRDLATSAGVPIPQQPAGPRRTPGPPTFSRLARAAAELARIRDGLVTSDAGKAALDRVIRVIRDLGATPPQEDEDEPPELWWSPKAGVLARGQNRPDRYYALGMGQGPITTLDMLPRDARLMALAWPTLSAPQAEGDRAACGKPVRAFDGAPVGHCRRTRHHPGDCNINRDVPQAKSGDLGELRRWVADLDQRTVGEASLGVLQVLREIDRRLAALRAATPAAPAGLDEVLSDADAVDVVAAALAESISEFVTARGADEPECYDADPREAARVAVEALRGAGRPWATPVAPAAPGDFPLLVARALRDGGWVSSTDTVLNHRSPFPERPVDELVADVVTALAEPASAGRRAPTGPADLGVTPIAELNALAPVSGPDDPDAGHTFFLAARSQMSSKVVGDAHNRDADWVDAEPLMLAVRAWNLRDALRYSLEADLADWARAGIVGRTDEPVPPRTPVVHPPTPAPLRVGETVGDAGELDRRAAMETIVEAADGGLGHRRAQTWPGDSDRPAIGRPDWKINGEWKRADVLAYPVTVVRAGGGS